MSQPRTAAALLPLTFALAACPAPPPSSSSTGGHVASSTPGSRGVPTPPSTTAAPAPLPSVHPPAPLAKPATGDELERLARAENAFALDFYGRTRGMQGNLVMSPFSVSTALAMTLLGAKGETAAQMAKVLRFEGAVDRMADVAGSLVGRYGAPDNKVTVRVVNRLFGERSYAFEQPYLTRVQAAFGAPLEPLDFRGAAPASRDRINAWVAGQTGGHIRDLLPPPAITPDTRLALVDAIYFTGDWAEPFEKDLTRPAPFSLDAKQKKDVPTMHAQGSFPFAATDGVKVLELAYQNGALAMDFVLPDAVDGLDAVEKRLIPAALEKWIGAGHGERVSVALPKFEIAPGASLSLGDTLSAMGMPDAFDRAKADFSGIANPRSPEERLYISSAFHKGFLRVDEKGTEAAAASAAVMARVGGAAPAAPPKEFKADHPFLYLLRDTRSGLILFMGRVADPSAK